MDEAEIINAVNDSYPGFYSWMIDNIFIDENHHPPTPEQLTRWEVWKEQRRKAELKIETKEILDELRLEG